MRQLKEFIIEHTEIDRDADYRLVNYNDRSGYGYEKIFFRGSNGIAYRKDGFNHRTTGPAAIHPDYKKEWWVDNRELKKADFHTLGFKIIKQFQAEELFTPLELIKLRLDSSK